MEFYSPIIYLVLLLAGIVAGIVNTLAGSGTIFSAGTMLFLGVPFTLANTTNRLGVLFQSVGGMLAIKRHADISNHIPKVALFATLMGALLGGYLATVINSRWLENLALVVVLGMVIHVISSIVGFNPLGKVKIVNTNQLTTIVLFFLAGCYGAFIQIGVGILLLLLLRMIYRRSWAESNYLKLLIILVYTVPTVIYFGVSGFILWFEGIVLAIGQIAGAYLAGWKILANEKVTRSIPYVVLLMLVLTGMKLLID